MDDTLIKSEPTSLRAAIGLRFRAEGVELIASPLITPCWKVRSGNDDQSDTVPGLMRPARSPRPSPETLDGSNAGYDKGATSLIDPQMAHRSVIGRSGL